MALGGHQTHAHCLHAVPQLTGFMTKRRGDRTRDLLTDWSLGPNPLSSSSLDNLDPHVLVKRKGRRDPTQMEGLIVQNVRLLTEPAKGSCRVSTSRPATTAASLTRCRSKTAIAKSNPFQNTLWVILNPLKHKYGVMVGLYLEQRT